MNLKLKIPDNIANIPEKAINFAYSAQEKLRFLHNQKGQDYKDGKISKQQWEDWKEDYFEPRSSAISIEIVDRKEQLKVSMLDIVDLDKDFE